MGKRSKYKGMQPDFQLFPLLTLHLCRPWEGFGWARKAPLTRKPICMLCITEQEALPGFALPKRSIQLRFDPAPLSITKHSIRQAPCGCPWEEQGAPRACTCAQDHPGIPHTLPWGQSRGQHRQGASKGALGHFLGGSCLNG